MKRSIITITAILALIHLCCNTTWARPITVHEAEQAAKGWLRFDPKPLETVLGGQVAKVETFNDTNGEPIYYVVYLEPAGFVILPADDMVEPIVCFADDGKYDPSTTNCLGALVNNDLNDRIATVRNVKSLEAHGRIEEAVKSQNKWGQLISLADSGEDDVVTQGLGSISDVRRAPLVQSRWSQSGVCVGYCYNYYTPNHYFCGCIATSMAQLMRYHQYPTIGIGVHERTIHVDGEEQTASTLGGNGSGGPYNWSQMPHVPACTLTLTQRQAIGALCYDAGVSVNMKYTSGGSAAYADMPKYALTSIFQYYNAVVGVGNNWNDIGPGLIAMVNPNLDAHSPVELGLVGHSVVCDGYGYHSSTMYHHLNMGWGGSDDAWYNLPNIGTSHGFNSVPSCTYNIRPTGIGDGEVISGRVLYANGAPIPNVTVYVGLNPPPPPPPPPPPSMSELESQSASFPVITSTDSKGIYAFSDLNSNTTYYVTGIVRGYVPLTLPVLVGESQNNHDMSGNVWGVDLVPATRLDCLYVDDDAPGDPGPGDLTVSDPLEDGSIQHPFDSIQEAIDAAINGDEIEVRPGTYYQTVDFKGKAIRLYSSNGPDVTIIDANGAYHVVQCVSGEDANTILEGFTITGGNANGSYPHNCGGGMLNAGSSPTVTDCNFSGNNAVNDGGGMYNYSNSSPTVSNCAFSNNSASYGAGMYNHSNSSPTVTNCNLSANDAVNGGGGMVNNSNSSPTVTSCTFDGNKATNADGGGMLNGNGSNPKVTDCTFSGNWANQGGGMHNLLSSPTIIECTFSDNEAGFNGGGMVNDNSNPTVSNCTFSSNSPIDKGGGMYNVQSSPTVTNCTFRGNTTYFKGGGMYNYSSSPTLTNCNFYHNVADYGGGGMYNEQSSPTVTNCTFRGNTSYIYGGGMYNYNSSSSIVTNCTFSGNTAVTNGGGIRNWDSSPTVTNCILWNNEPDEISSEGTSAPVVNYSDIRGGHIGTGNINTDPNFIDANNPDPNLWNLRLSYDSPCIDAGDTTAVPSGIFVDVDGNPRVLDYPASPNTGIDILGVTVDMGAYEFQLCQIPGDVNCDGVVDFRDVAMICANWLAGTEPEL